MGASVFLRGRIRPRHIVPCARLCTGHLGIEVARLKPWNTAVLIEVSICFYIYTKTLLLTTHFQYKLMKHLPLWGLLIISTRFLSENHALEGGGYLIWFDYCDPALGILTKNSSEKSNAPGLTLIDALVPLKGEKQFSSQAHKTGAWYLSGVISKIPDEHTCRFYLGVTPWRLN